MHRASITKCLQVTQGTRSRSRRSAIWRKALNHRRTPDAGFHGREEEAILSRRGIASLDELVKEVSVKFRLKGLSLSPALAMTAYT